MPRKSHLHECDEQKL